MQNYDNEKVKVSASFSLMFVKEIRRELGDFDYDAHPNNNQNKKLEFIQMLEQENHARYEGQW